MTRFFFGVLYFELLLFFRDKKTSFYSLGFFMLVALLFPIALSPHPDLLEKFAPGILWTAALFAALLTLEAWLSTELEDQSLDQMLLCSYPLPWLIAAKIMAFWLAAILPLLFATPLLALTLQLSRQELGILLLSLLAGTPAFIAIGATCKTLTLRLQHQGSLLGLLVLPLTLPVLMTGINTLLASRMALPFGGQLAFLAGLSVLCLCLLPLAIAYVLRFGTDG